MTAPLPAPFTAFNFSVEIIPDGDPAALCAAAFAECDGLEITLDVKTIREGGNNGAQPRLVGAAAYGELVLKRGMTEGYALWTWVERTITDPSLRAETEVVVLAPDRTTVQVAFRLARCVPVKLKAPALNAREGIVAIEELHVAYEQLSVRQEGGHG